MGSKRNNRQKRRQRVSGRASRGGVTPASPRIQYYYKSTNKTSRESGDTEKDTNKTTKTSRRIRFIVGFIVFFSVLAITLPVFGKPKIQLENPSKLLPNSQPTKYESTIEHIIYNSYTNRTKATFNSESVSRTIKTKFPEVDSVRIDFSIFGHRPTVEIKLKRPALVLKISNEHYLLDANGVVIGIGGKTKSVPIALPIVEDNSEITPRVGRAALPSNYVNYISQLISQLRSAGKTVDKMVLPPESSEIDLWVNDSKYFVKFNLRGSARVGAGTYLAAVKYLARHKETINNYIDVRIPGRAYYQ